MNGAGQPAGVSYASNEPPPSAAVALLPLVFLALLAIPLVLLLRRSSRLQQRSLAHMDRVERELEKQTELLRRIAKE